MSQKVIAGKNVNIAMVQSQLCGALTFSSLISYYLAGE